MSFLSYNEFLNETDNISIDKDLREYTLSHMNDDMFQIKSDDLFKEFSVLPYKKELLDKLKTTCSSLVEAMEKNDVQKIYSAVIKAEDVPYNYGDIYNAKFSLVDVPELSTSLDPGQQKSLAASEREFMLNTYSQLGKSIKDDIFNELKERAEVLCVVIEALFYYVRIIDKDSFYKGKNSEELIEDYTEAIDKSVKDSQFSIEGPFSDMNTKDPIDDETEIAYWECEKNMKKFFIQAIISPKELYNQDKSGTANLKFSLSLPGEKTSEKDYSFFDINELTSKIKLFCKNILKK